MLFGITVIAFAGHAVPRLSETDATVGSGMMPLILTLRCRARRAQISTSRGESYGLDQSGFRRSRSLLRNQLLRERKTLNWQDAHSDPRFWARGRFPQGDFRRRKFPRGGGPGRQDRNR